MSLSAKRKLLILSMILLPILVVACSIFYPPEIRYESYLSPVIVGENPSYTIDQETDAFIFDIGGSTVQVEYMREDELNNLFPDESNDDLYSTNPYTYGNWVDPEIGYTPYRFTTFRITILNRNFAKMRLDPVEAVLITDLGETYHTYTYSIAAAKYGNSFENYFRTIRGLSGNEYYRHEMRLGMVRGKNYGLDEVIFRGDSYAGLITFDVLRPEVARVQLVLNDIVYRFDAFNRPADVTTATFNFERKINEIVVTPEMKQAELEREKVRIRIAGPQQIVNNRVNDNARNAFAIDRILEANSPRMEECFLQRYRRDEVDPGSMVLSFTIGVDGSIISQNVIEVVGINSESFMNCILDVIETLNFESIKDMPLDGTDLVKGPAEEVNVLYPLDFAVYIEE